MKILMQGRRDLLDFYGGDSTQVLKTKEYLERLGVNVDISKDLLPDVSGYDLIHIFNAPFYDILPMTINAKRAGKKVVYSPIYLDYSVYDKSGRGGLAGLASKVLDKYGTEDLKLFASIARKGGFPGSIPDILKGYRRCLCETLRNVDFLLPNSNSEIARMEKDFPVGKIPYIVVPYAVDNAFTGKAADIDNGPNKLKGCVMSAARIENRKNQLSLVKAMKGLPYGLVLIGKIGSGQQDYFRRIQKEAGPNFHYLGSIEHSDMPKYYRLAKVHCLVSWMETCGLASMEAAVMGCNIVITDKGDTREYYRDYAHYCNPGSVESIRKAIVKAYESPYSHTLRSLIVDNYTWEKAAEITLEAYSRVLKK
ncbi:MAG: glycosyltransferase family 4 protein [Dehalococcoidales bacterium]|jgi:glycosyltransferase involved in cell wall biosynthesis